MNPVVTIALLTLREAVRRRLVAACAAITTGLVALSAWGFDRLSHNASITSGEVGVAIPQALILFMFMFSFVVALSASAMASPAISAEAESGVLLSILARPVRRSEVLLGKWLGLATVILAYSAVVSGLEVDVRHPLVEADLPPAEFAGFHGGVHVLAPQFRSFREPARLLVGGIGASRRWRG